MDRLKILFDKYNNKQSSPEEERELLDLFGVENNESLLKDYIYMAHKEDFEQSEELDLAVDEVYENLHKQIFDQNDLPVKRLSPLKWLAIAATVTVVVFGAGLFYINRDKVQNQTILVHNNDVAPGKQGATLILANGKKIRLTEAGNGELAEEAGVTITKTANGQLNYVVSGTDSRDPSEVGMTNVLSTAKGETYIVTLPDNSKVWLNAASSLTYTVGLNEHGKRKVKLDGEAYFEIAKDKAHPFIVESKAQTVQVLGTHFNINAYKDEPQIATTLLEGSVKINSGAHQQLLIPGQQAINNGSALTVKNVDVKNITAWKDGDFFLNHLSFKAAMRQIARWYDVEVIYDTSVPDEMQAGGWISRNKNLSQVLQAIQETRQVHFKVEGRRIFVSK